MKVISNTILFVYSLRIALIEIVRVCHTRWGNFLPWNNPITGKGQKVSSCVLLPRLKQT